MTAARTVHIIDDEPAIRDALSWLFDSRGLTSSTYASSEAFLCDFLGMHPRTPGEAQSGSTIPCGAHCLLLDLRMGGMSGLELQDELDAQGVRLPIIFLSGHGSIPIAVRALHHGAVDFIEKPFNDNALVDRVIACLDADAHRAEARLQHARIRERLARLTPRDVEVMEHLFAGKYNKVIAEEMGVSARTVEVHRSAILRKMGARNAVELAHMLAMVRPPPDRPGTGPMLAHETK
ncbi:MAG TPA: response regulator [Casimicrobiaceae bacterium]|jgi:two-component system response regulator DctR